MESITYIDSSGGDVPNPTLSDVRDFLVNKMRANAGRRTQREAERMDSAGYKEGCFTLLKSFQLLHHPLLKLSKATKMPVLDKWIML
jgi:hypothetical protein